MNNIVRLPAPAHFEPDKIFDCGQSFRFERRADGSWEGVAYGCYLRVLKTCGALEIEASDNDASADIWRRYLALDEDYDKVNLDIISHFSKDSIMPKAIAIGDGIRLLRQEPWETLCSFIISQNNNIPRIKSLISALCRTYGESFEYRGREYHRFPTPQALLDAGEEALKALKVGFRAGYIISAAEHCTTDIDLNDIRKNMTYEEGLASLCSIKGVGPKVASCALLFSLDKTDAFPVDVWIKRVIDRRFGGVLDTSALGKYAGIAQQYMFYYERYVADGQKEDAT